MKSQYSVSIIVPVYNVEKYIERCLKSIINQSYDGNIECLLVNDASTDNSVSIINAFLKYYTGKIDFKLLNHHENSGLSVARNTGIENAKGDFLYFLDSDDEITYNCISILVDFIGENTEIVQGSAKILPISNHLEQYVAVNNVLPDFISDDNVLIKQLIMFKLIPVTAWNKLVKRDFIINNNLFFKNGLIHEDDYWNYIIAKKVTSISFVKEYTYYYHMNEGSIINTYNKNSFISLCKIIELCLFNLDKVREKDQLHFIEELLVRVGTNIIAYVDSKDINELNNYLISAVLLYKKNKKIKFRFIDLILIQMSWNIRIRRFILFRKLWFLTKIIFDRSKNKRCDIVLNTLSNGKSPL